MVTVWTRGDPSHFRNSRERYFKFTFPGNLCTYDGNGFPNRMIVWSPYMEVCSLSVFSTITTGHNFSTNIQLHYTDINGITMSDDGLDTLKLCSCVQPGHVKTDRHRPFLFPPVGLEAAGVNKSSSSSSNSPLCDDAVSAGLLLWGFAATLSTGASAIQQNINMILVLSPNTSTSHKYQKH